MWHTEGVDMRKAWKRNKQSFESKRFRPPLPTSLFAVSSYYLKFFFSKVSLFQFIAHFTEVIWKGFVLRFVYLIWNFFNDCRASTRMKKISVKYKSHGVRGVWQISPLRSREPESKLSKALWSLSLNAWISKSMSSSRVWEMFRLKLIQCLAIHNWK